ncbi:MAG: hypothetical protein GY722_15215 [bacterium]|nr:hypothetical protein [bacterium]
MLGFSIIIIIAIVFLCAILVVLWQVDEIHESAAWKFVLRNAQFLGIGAAGLVAVGGLTWLVYDLGNLCTYGCCALVGDGS